MGRSFICWNDVNEALRHPFLDGSRTRLCTGSELIGRELARFCLRQLNYGQVAAAIADS